MHYMNCPCTGDVISLEYPENIENRHGLISIISLLSVHCVRLQCMDTVCKKYKDVRGYILQVGYTLHGLFYLED
jgi:hypothetical protein